MAVQMLYDLFYFQYMLENGLRVVFFATGCLCLRKSCMFDVLSLTSIVKSVCRAIHTVIKVLVLCELNILLVRLMFLLQGVFEVDYEKGLILSEIADGVSVDDVKAATGCSFQVRERQL